MYRGSRLCALGVWLVACDHFQLYHIDSGFLLACGAEQRESHQHSVLVYPRSCLSAANRAVNPSCSVLIFVHFYSFTSGHGSASECLALRRRTLSRVEIFVPWISLFKHLMILLLILVTHRLSDDASSSAMFTGIIFRIHLPSRPTESTSFYDPWAIIDVTRDLSVLHEGRIDKFSVFGRKPQSTERSMKRRLSPRR